jgi:hypothetical protein
MKFACKTFTYCSLQVNRTHSQLSFKDASKTLFMSIFFNVTDLTAAMP